MSKPFERAARAAWWATSVGMVMTTASGLGLLFSYQPSGDATSRAFRLAHLGSLAIVGQGLVATGVVGILASDRPTETARRILGFVVAMLALLVAAFTGTLLAWDQLALRSVTTGSEFHGFQWVTRDDVEFVVVNNTMVGLDAVRRLLTVHAGAALVVILAGIVMPRLLSRRSDT